ncbi:MAG: N-acetylneuraminate synthase family protein [Phycisphaerae bacterium]|nr:N-acetylneuraminate synthase family protein [Phycisphaerae bacterium]
MQHADRNPSAGSITAERRPRIQIGQRPVGAACPTFIVAEVGVNHNGDRALASELIDAADQAGADAVKLQAFDPDALCSSRHRADEREMLARYTLDEQTLAEMRDRAAAAGLIFLVTPFGFDQVDLIARLDVPAIKVGSGEVTHTPLLRYIGATRLPVLLSTGAADLQDVKRAVTALRRGGCDSIALLHCTSVYPAPDSALNLRAITTMAELFDDCVIGYSDHSMGTTAGLAAVALGAAVIEKHLTMSKTLDGPDHTSSAEPDELARLVREIRRFEQMAGDGLKRPAEYEGIIGQSLVAARGLHAGHVVTPGDLTFKRPGWGMRPYQQAQVVGRRLRMDLPYDEVLTHEHIDWDNE